MNAAPCLFHWPSWKSLSALGNIYFLQVSYLVLVGVPILAAIQQKTLAELFHEVPLTLRLGYFSALLLSIAHMLYQGYCPRIIRRFDSPNDMYRDMLEIKALQHQFLSDDKNFTFDIAHCREGFTTANSANTFPRAVCAIFYGAGLLLFAWLVLERSLTVLGITFSAS